MLSLLLSTAALADREHEPSVHVEGALLDRSDHDRAQMFSFFAGVPYYGGWRGSSFPAGFGLRYYVPILKDGFIPAANDEFGIEFGGDFAVFSHRFGAFYGVSVPVELLWDFHFAPRFDAYVKVGGALAIGFGTYDGTTPAPYGFYPISALGMRIRLGDAVYLRAEAGYPWAKIGLGFAI